MFSDAGPDVRWVGNEKGIAGDPSWATLDRDDFAPGEADEARLNRGDRPGTHWLPAECDVSIRPGWFYHAAEDDEVKTPLDLLDLYYKSVGRGASFLLNLPPDRRGRIHENDERSLRGFRQLLDATFATDLARGARASASNVRGGDARFAAANVLDGKRDTYWTTDDAVTTPELVLDLGRPVTFNVVSLREHLPLGQRVEDWALDAWRDGAWREFAKGTADRQPPPLARRGRHHDARPAAHHEGAGLPRDLGARPPPRAARGAVHASAVHARGPRC